MKGKSGVQEVSSSQTLAQDSKSDVSMTLRRRSRRLSSEEPESFSACSSAKVLGVDISEGESLMKKSNDGSPEMEQMRIETLQQKDSSSQNSPVAFRTRSRSRCSSVESNDAGVVGDAQKTVNIALTPKKKLTTPVKSFRKRTSLMPPLEEITEEQLKYNDEDNNEEKLMGRKTETKKVLQKEEKLSEKGKEHNKVEILGEASSTEGSNEDDTSAEDVADGKKSMKVQRKTIKKSWDKTKRKPTESFAKVQEKSLTRSSKKTLANNADHFLENDVNVFPEKNSESSADVLEKSSAMSLKKLLEKNPEEMLTNDSSCATDYLGQEAKLITETNLKETVLNIWPELGDLSSLWLRHNLLVDNIGKAYAFVNELDTEVPTISQELITTDSEMIWQQIAYGNKKFHRYFAKIKHFLDVEISTNKQSRVERNDSLSSATTSIFQNGNTENGSKSSDNEEDSSEEDKTDLFNLTEDEIKRLDGNNFGKNNDDNHSNSSDSEDIVSEVSDSGPRKRWKSKVDDHFFSLAEMEEYLDKQEKDQTNLDENFLEQFDQDEDDLQNSQADYHYTDFYGSTDSVGEKNGSKSNSKKLNKSRKISQSGELKNHTEKRVTFAEEITDNVDYEKDDDDGRHDDGDAQETPVLLGRVDEEVDNETEFQRRQKKLQERIASIEQANLAPRNWDLSGEVTAMEREENTMLEKHFDFDQSVPSAPLITIDTTAHLEAIIIQRIKDRVFDDVLRTERESKLNAAYRTPVAEPEIVKKSLAEVYEEQYQKTQHGTGNETTTNEKHEEIKKMVSELYQKLNALCHYRYIPLEVHPEVRIINNMPSLQKEEVGPLASTDAVLLAPEEIYKHISAPMKGDDEKTKTDRSRSLRKKKKWQHIRQLKEKEAEISSTDQIPAKKTKLASQYDNKRNKKLTSTSFFQNLQTKVAEEVKGQKHKTSEMGATRKKLSTNYKL